MKKYMIPLIAVAAMMFLGLGVGVETAEAGGCGYGGYGGYGYSAYSPVINHGWYHNTGHFDYHPGGFVPHGNHFDYVPGHYDWHNTGHWHW